MQDEIWEFYLKLKQGHPQWQWHDSCYFVSFVMYISGAKFEDHCFNISGDILNSVFYRFS